MKHRFKLWSASLASTATDLPALPEGEEIYDIMPRVHIPSYFWIWVLMLLLAMVAAFLYWLKTRKQEVEEPAKPVVKECPRKLARAALNKLVNSDALKKGLYKDVCADLMPILKTYAADMFEVGTGAGATSDEFVGLLSNYRLLSEVVLKIKNLCEKSDIILYTGHEAASVEIQQMISDVKYLIELDRW